MFIICVSSIQTHFAGSSVLLLGDDFVQFVENAFVPGKMKRLVPNFKKMQNMIPLIHLDKLQRRQVVSPHIFSRNADLKISDIIKFPCFHSYTSIQLTQSPDNSAFNISST